MYIQSIHICMYVYMYIYAYYTYVGKKSLSDNSPARAHEDISLVIYRTTAVVVIYNPTSVVVIYHPKSDNRRRISDI